MSDLLADLESGESENYHKRDCPACVALSQVDDNQTRAALERALAGTIGANKLSGILRGHGIAVSCRQILKHRTEKRPTP